MKFLPSKLPKAMFATAVVLFVLSVGSFIYCVHEPISPEARPPARAYESSDGHPCWEDAARMSALGTNKIFPYRWFSLYLAMGGLTFLLLGSLCHFKQDSE